MVDVNRKEEKREKGSPERERSKDLLRRKARVAVVQRSKKLSARLSSVILSARQISSQFHRRNITCSPMLPLSICARSLRCSARPSNRVERLTVRSLNTHLKNDGLHVDIPSLPFRSVLYVPASNTRALNKLSSLTGRSKPDAVMFDLEDGVGPDNKGQARENLVNFFEQSEGSTDSFFKLVRINRMDTPWFEADAITACRLLKNENSFDAVVLPKIEGWDDLEFATAHFQTHLASNVPFWAMMETPKAILSAAAIASHPRVHGLILGTNDLGKEIQLRPSTLASKAEGSDSLSAPKSTFSIGSTSATVREGLVTSLQTTILAARAYGKIVIDGVYNNFHDATGFHYECTQGKEWGMDGKTLIHPNQVSVTNQIFAPSDEEVDHATRVVECWNEAVDRENFSGVAVLDGALIELLHVKAARKILDSAQRIKSIETS
ncbi:hypothetical protein HJC23_002248 [Cyclotella cryptica]|uniref:HpcH/HpaI aldolase/citrate lyase domain-containing protein n=1 Tax=Cyclotella cryptica TaxID=29204 RepID=A0ABD3QFV3_9STRA